MPGPCDHSVILDFKVCLKIYVGVCIKFYIYIYMQIDSLLEPLYIIKKYF